MKTLAILAQKGGSGKTTIAVHMAVCAARRKLKTAIVDIDPQRSAFQWNESRSDERKLDAVAADAGQLAALLRQADAAGVQLAIIDTAPHSSGDAALAAKLADLILIPCRPARFDLDAIASTLEIAKAANTPAAVVINAAATRGKLAEEAGVALTRQGIIVLNTILHQRVAYSHAVIDGRSVHEYEPDGAAAAEVEELYHHVTRLYGSSERKVKAA
ncbi:MAG TPA: ParA family partition ATPase [Candidatus Binataceae bacterium]|nr:ParA family partition ATPase [Candidatus Binataceae bacterium]